MLRISATNSASDSSAALGPRAERRHQASNPWRLTLATAHTDLVGNPSAFRAATHR